MTSASESFEPAIEPKMVCVEGDSDADLLERVGEHDLSAFELLYARYARAVYAMAARRLRDGGHAEDATQDAFAAVWRFADRYVPERGRPLAVHGGPQHRDRLRPREASPPRGAAG